MLQAAIPRYMAPTVAKRERAAILRNIVHQVQQNAGRFIVKLKNKLSSMTTGGQQQQSEQQQIQKSTGLMQHKEEESGDYKITKFAFAWEELDDLTAHDRVGYALVPEAKKLLWQEEERKEHQKQLILQQMRTRQEGGQKEFWSIHNQQPNDDKREDSSLKTTAITHDYHDFLKDLIHAQPQ
ncbi:hypothetical protein ACA910_022293 [Epithemia clementina (nom. ined.)]